MYYYVRPSVRPSVRLSVCLSVLSAYWLTVTHACSVASVLFDPTIRRTDIYLFINRLQPLLPALRTRLCNKLQTSVCTVDSKRDLADVRYLFNYSNCLWNQLPYWFRHLDP